jgi:2',3'-cyclic-nucleotide 2'-phosphodiesterase (5'-nucleotidase family)
MPQHNLSIVAVTTVDVPDIAQPDAGTTFEPYSMLQGVIDGLLDGSIGNGTTTRVIALTHIGYENDVALAKSLRRCSLLVGGHSHTALGGDPKYSQGDYPTLVKDADGEDVMVVTAYRWGEYLGRIDVAFEAGSGKIAAYTGGECRAPLPCALI